MNYPQALARVSVAVAALGLWSLPAAAQWQPDRPVEFIAMYGPGGGHDIMMRTASQMMTDLGILEVPVQVRNLPGGSGARAMQYLQQQEGSPYHVSAATSTLLTTPLRGGTEVTYEDFTPIALLALDPAIIVVNADSPYQSLGDVIEAGQEEVVNWGGTSIGGQDHLIALRLAEETGAQLNYVPFDGDGALAAALIGGQVDITGGNYSSVYDFIVSGEFRPLAASADERLADLPDTPTLEELGYDATVMLPRSVIGPPDMPQEAVDFWVEAFRELSQSEQWQENYIERYNVLPGERYGEDFGAYLDESHQFFEGMLEQAGLIE